MVTWWCARSLKGFSMCVACVILLLSFAWKSGVFESENIDPGCGVGTFYDEGAGRHRSCPDDIKIHCSGLKPATHKLCVKCCETLKPTLNTTTVGTSGLLITSQGIIVTTEPTNENTNRTTPPSRGAKETEETNVPIIVICLSLALVLVVAAFALYICYYKKKYRQCYYTRARSTMGAADSIIISDLNEAELKIENENNMDDRTN